MQLIQIWQIADSENRGLLTPAGFGIVLRLIGYAQAGRPVSFELAMKREWISQVGPTMGADCASYSWWTTTQIRWHHGAISATANTGAGTASASAEQWSHQSSSVDSGQGWAVLISLRRVRRAKWNIIRYGYILPSFLGIDF